MLHRRRIWTVKWHSPDCATVHPDVTHGSLDPPQCTTQTASRSVQLFLYSSCQSVVGHVRACPSPKNCALTWGNLDHHATWFLGPTRVQIPNGISIGSAVFAQTTALQCPILYNGRPFPSKFPLPMGDMEPI